MEPISIISKISIFLGKLVLNKVATKSLDKIWKCLKNPEYAKYKNCFKPPFINAFKSTLNIFYDDISPYLIPKDLYSKLSNLDDIALGVIFQDINIVDIPYNNSAIYSVLADKLKIYNLSLGYNLEDEFYVYWKEIFAKQYELSFKVFFRTDDSFCRDAIVDVFSISLEAFDTIIANQSIINKNIQKSKDEILAEVSNIPNQIQSSLQHTLLSCVPIKEINEDSELKKIQNLIDKNKYEDGISYITLNINDNWKYKSDNFKAKMYNKLGVCYQNLNDTVSAKQAYKRSCEVNSEYDNPLYNLAHIALDENDYESYLKYLPMFNDKDSELYKKLEFLKYICITQEFAIAKNYLESNLKRVEDYLFLKALLDLKNPQKLNYKAAEKNLKKYITEIKPSDVIAKYNLVNCQFINLFNKSKLCFVFDINVEGTLKIVPNVNVAKQNKTAQKLLEDLEDVLNGLNKTYKNHKYLITSIEVKIHLTKYFLGKFEQDTVNVSKINSIITHNNPTDNSILLECIFLNILCNQYSKANDIYKLLDDDTKKICKNNYLIILFGEQKFTQVLEQLKEEDSVLGINEQFKIISLYKANGWEQTKQYLKNNYTKYDDQLLLLCVWLYHENLHFDDELNLLKQIAERIIKNPKNYACPLVYKVSHCLAFFNTKNEINELREQLIEIYWSNNKSKENFDIGMLNTIDLFNKGMYSKCLSNLEILEKYDPDNVTIKSLYAQIDSINYNLDTLIENYEKGVREDFLLPMIAKAYIGKKEYQKAENLINSLKYMEKSKLQYFYLKIELGVAKKIEDAYIIEIFVQGLQEFPDDLQLNQCLFNFLLKSNVVNDKTRELFQKCSQVMKNNNLLWQFEIDKEKPLESLTKALETFEPRKNYLKREQLYVDGLNNYNNFKYPLALISELFGVKSGILFANFIENIEQIIPLTRRSNEEYKDEVDRLNKNKNIIMNVPSLILLKALDLDGIVFSNLKIKITAQTKNQINFILNDITGETTEKLIRDKDGNPHISYVKNEANKYKEYLKTCLDTIETANFKSQSQKALALIEASEKLGSNELLYDAIVSVQNNFLICSSDEVMHTLSNEFKFQDISIISIINFLKQKNIITNKKEAELKYKLVEFNCKYIPLTAEDIYLVTDLELNKLKKILKYLDDNFDKESVVDVLSEYIYLLSQDKNFSNSKIYEIINLVFDKCVQLTNNTSFVKIFMNKLIQYHHLLNNLVQKYIAYKFWNAEPDKNYVESYYKFIMHIPAKKKYDNKQRNIQEIRRIAFNAPINIRNSLKNYANFIILYGKFNEY